MNNIKSDEQLELQSLLMTKKEIKKLRKYELDERKKEKLQDEYKDIEDNTEIPDEYKMLKAKLDSVQDISIVNKDKSEDEIEYEDNNDKSLDKKEDDNDDVDFNNFSIVNKIKDDLIKIQPKNEIQLNSQNNSIVQPDLVKPRATNDAGKVIQNQVSTPPMDDSGDVDLNKLFSSEVGNESEVVKELFSSENIKVKTDLSEREISIISRLELQASITQNFLLSRVLKELETLRVSKDRKSRNEFVQSFSGIRSDNSGATAFGNFGKIFKNDKV